MSVSTQATHSVRPIKKTEPARRATLVAWACLLIVWVVWGSTYLAIRVGVETMPPLLMAAARNLIAGAIMLTVSSQLASGLCFPGEPVGALSTYCVTAGPRAARR
jgi:drug/metabolite transporter (DMT)-like permease